MSRRIVCIHLPRLLCELASEASHSQEEKLPFAVVFDEPEGSTLLQAVSDSARSSGLRPGQTVAEAKVLVSHLSLRRVERERVMNALGRVAEVGLAFGPSASIDLGKSFSTRDAVWVDVTGCTTIAEGEQALVLDLVSSVRKLGHRTRIALASGPMLARAFALHSPSTESIVSPGNEAQMSSTLPVAALPLSIEQITWFARLGVLTIQDMRQLPEASLFERLGDGAIFVLSLIQGRDDSSWIPYEPARIIREEIAWDDTVFGVEPILFAMRGLVSRVAARLEGRGEATLRLELSAPYDPSMARLRDLRSHWQCRIDMPVPLARFDEMFRVLKHKLEDQRLLCPIQGLSVEASKLTPSPRRQLSFGRSATVSPDALPLLLAELSSDMKGEQMGVLRKENSHRPESQGTLSSLFESKASFPVINSVATQWPTRILPRPIALEGELEREASWVLDDQLLTVDSFRHSMRLDRVEWWTPAPLSRDYWRVWLRSTRGGLAAWVFVERDSHRLFLHGLYD